MPYIKIQCRNFVVNPANERDEITASLELETDGDAESVANWLHNFIPALLGLADKWVDPTIIVYTSQHQIKDEVHAKVVG